MTRRRRESDYLGRAFGAFLVEERLGEGGFGAVYRAKQTPLDREAVVKILHRRRRVSPAHKERFLREARLASQLDHPYAAHIYGFGAESDGTMWIAMELVRGSTLRNYIQAHKRLPIERFAPLLERICEVVHTAHGQGIVHRDIKPSNVMVLSRAGRLLPKLLDFGIAKSMLIGDVERADAVVPDAAALSEFREAETIDIGDDSGPRGARASSTPESLQLTGDGAMMGSPSYMAPEQWTDAASAGPRSDLYALGVLAFEAVTGARPFVGDMVELRRAHASGVIPQVPDDLPVALNAVFVRAMAKDPGDRFESALELAEAFREASGLSLRRAPLPRLEETVLERFLADAPQPLAEAIGALDSARDLREARDAVWAITATLSRYMAIVAVAARSRLRWTATTPAEADALQRLGAGVPTPEEWMEIAGALAGPYAACSELHPVPELVAFHCDPGGEPGEGVALFEALAEMREPLAGAGVSDEAMRERLTEALAALSALLGRAAFLCDYALVVPTGERSGDKWVGVRRAGRTAMALPPVALAVGQPILVDGDGAPVLSLHPLAQVAPPTPGAAAEMFLYAGHGRGGAQLTAEPRPFRSHEPEILEWLRSQLRTTVDTRSHLASDRSAPYLGLRSFSPADAGRFRGRERQVDAFVNRLQIQPLLAVLGESGAGKSSFVQAGVIPSLDGWRSVTLRPGVAPMSALIARLREAGVADGDELPSEPGALGDRLRADAEANGPVVLVVDQLEELFTLCSDPEERDRFATALSEAARAVEDPVRVILTLRDDFLVQAESLAALRERLGRGLQLLTTPALGDLERIVREPAREVGYEFEDSGLPRRMAAEVADHPGALALISFTAAKLWERRDRHFRRIPSQAYDAIGGVGGALAQHAEELLESMPAEQRGLVRKLFVHLVTAEGTRAVRSRGELRDRCGGGSSSDGVIETLIAGRLLVTSESEDGDDHVEIIHEALLSAWPRLVNWLRDAEEGARVRDQLHAAVSSWEARGRPRALLWRGELLVELERWRAGDPELTSGERAFADASRADATRGRRLRRGALIGSLALLSAGVLSLLLLNNQIAQQRSLADDQRARAEENLVKLYEENGRQALLARDYFRAATYLSAAYSRGIDRPALRFMLAESLRPMRAASVVLDHGRPISWVSFSPDGSRLVTAGFEARQPKVWSVPDGALLHTLPEQPGRVRMVPFSATGDRLATAGSDGVARVFSADRGELLRELEHGARVWSVAFSPTNDRLATGGGAGHAKIWSLEDGALLHTLVGGESLIEVVWSPDGSQLVTTNIDGQARIFDSQIGAQQSVLEHLGGITKVLWPRDDLIVTASTDGSARVWRADTGEVRVEVRVSSAIVALGFDPAGELFATADTTGNAQIWELANGRARGVLEGHRGVVTSVVFSPDGERLVTTSVDGTARVWSRAGALVGVLGGQSAPLRRAVFDPSATHIAAASSNGTAQLWSAPRRSRVKTIDSGGAQIRSVVFNRDGRLLTASALDGTVRVIDARRKLEIARIETPSGAVVAAPIGDELIAVSHSGELSVWSLSGERRATYKTTTVWHAQTSPDGRYLLTVGEDRASIWRIEGERLEMEREMPAEDATFLADGQVLIASLEGDVVRWNHATRAETLRIGDGAQVVVSCQGDRFLTLDPANTLARWDPRGTKLRAVSLKPHYNLGGIDAACALGVAFGDNGLPTIVDLETGRPLSLLESMPRNFSFMNISPDGSQVAAAEQSRIWLWDIEQTADSPAEVEALVRCKVPYRIAGADLEPAPIECSP